MSYRDERVVQGIQTHEDEDEPRETGLLGPDGQPLYRISERRPIGFLHRYED